MIIRDIISRGVLLYAAIYLLWSLFTVYGFVGGIGPQVVGLAALIALVATMARQVSLPTRATMVWYAFGWAAIFIVIDTLLVVPQTGWLLFTDAWLWVGYFTVLVVPLLAAGFGSHEADSEQSE